MSEDSTRDTIKLSYEDLYQQNLALRHELDDLELSLQSIWALFVDTSRKLQVSSASIKAAVSSLLNYDILWDGANQHEFLTTINASVDQVAKWVALLALAFRAEEGSLELKREPQDLQEIISIVLAHRANAFPKLMLAVALPADGRPVLVDYEYLIAALELMCETFEANAGVDRIQVQTTENQDHWFLDFKHLDQSIVALVLSPLGWRTNRMPNAPSLPLEHPLRLHVARQILRLQGIEVEALDSTAGVTGLRLRVPVAMTESSTP